MSTERKIIEGKEKECRILQDPIFIYVLKDFGREDWIPIGHQANHFKQIVKNLHNTMRSPYGKLESMRKNSTRDEIQHTLYAVKDLDTLPKLISEEEYFRLTCFMDTEFLTKWNEARQAAQVLLHKIKKFGPGNRRSSITQSMIDRYINEHDLGSLRKELDICIQGIFGTWQDIWYKYQEISTFANNLGNKT